MPLVTEEYHVGEMPAELLWETTMDPARRRLIRITMNDAEEAEEMLSVCMGKNVKVRKDFIISEGAQIADSAA